MFDSGKNRWAGLILLLSVLGFGIPVYEQVHQALRPNLHAVAAFTLGVLVAVVVCLPVIFAVNRIVEREQESRPNDPAAMAYRPGLLPTWVFVIAALKNPQELTEPTPWAALGVLLALVGVVVFVQYRRRQAWSWWIAVPVGVVIGLLALGAGAGLSELIRPKG